MDAETRIPVTVIGGYLGAGKTTLVNRLLRQADGLRLAVLVNEFGDLPIDADLIEGRDDNVINIAGGCVCCSYGSDLMAALMQMTEMDPLPDHLLIEASGVALPDAIARSARLIQLFTHDGIVVLADGETVRDRGEDIYLADTIAAQLAAADIVLLNKDDLLSSDQREATREWLAARAKDAQVIDTEEADVPLSVLLGSGLDRELAHRHAHAAHQAAVFEIDRPVAAEALAGRLADPALDLVRAKGFVTDLDGRLKALQVVGRRWRIEDAPPETTGPGRLVCIGVGQTLDENAIAVAIAAEPG